MCARESEQLSRAEKGGEPSAGGLAPVAHASPFAKGSGNSVLGSLVESLGRTGTTALERRGPGPRHAGVECGRPELPVGWAKCSPGGSSFGLFGG